MRQIPYTMMKFACFERTVEMLYKYVVPKPRSECSKSEQLVVTFVAGYIGKSRGKNSDSRRKLGTVESRDFFPLCVQLACFAPSCPTPPILWCLC